MGRNDTGDNDWERSRDKCVDRRAFACSILSHSTYKS